jgi:alpha-tubulin suppressor-like RCC1 family protein
MKIHRELQRDYQKSMSGISLLLLSLGVAAVCNTPTHHPTFVPTASPTPSPTDFCSTQPFTYTGSCSPSCECVCRNGSTIVGACAAPSTSNYTRQAVSAGPEHTCFIEKGSNQVYCAGSNSAGQLGDGTNTPSSTPVAVLAPAFAISAGGLAFPFSCAINGTSGIGAMFCWGDNSFGQFGDGTVASSNVPVQNLLGLRTKMICTGGAHSCAIDSIDQLYCWGLNSEGQLGTGINTISPSLVGGALYSVAVSFVSCGSAHTCAIRASDSRTFCWGRNFEGQLGLGYTGSPNAFPQAVVYPLNVSASALSLGVAYHTCAITTSANLLYCWGYSPSGNLGVGPSFSTYEPTPLAVAGVLSGVAVASVVVGTNVGDGSSSTCAITRDYPSRLYCFGSDAHGQLGDTGGTVTSPADVPVLVVQSSGDTTSDTVYAAVTLSVHVCAITFLNKLYCWGRGTSGQLADGASTTYYNPQLVPLYEISSTVNLCNVTSDDNAFCRAAVPTASPTRNPTKSPTKSPSQNPTASPSQNPTKSPTKSPSQNPTKSPTTSPSQNPTASPTRNPTKSPTSRPTPPPTTCTVTDFTTTNGSYTHATAPVCSTGGTVLQMIYNGTAGGWFDNGGPTGIYGNNAASRIVSPTFNSSNATYPLFLTIEMSATFATNTGADTFCVHLRNVSSSSRLSEFYPVLLNGTAWYPMKDTATTTSACNPNVVGFCTVTFPSLGLTKSTFFIPPIGIVWIEFAFRSDSISAAAGFQIYKTELCQNDSLLSLVEVIPATPCTTFDFANSSQNWLSTELGTAANSMCNGASTAAQKMLYNPGIGWSDNGGTAGNYSNTMSSRIVSPPVVITTGVNNILTFNATLQTDGSTNDRFCVYVYNSEASTFSSLSVVSSSATWTSVLGGATGSCHRSSTNSPGLCMSSATERSGIHKFTIPSSISTARVEFTFVSGGAPSAPGWIIYSAGLCST